MRSTIHVFTFLLKTLSALDNSYIHTCKCDVLKIDQLNYFYVMPSTLICHDIFSILGCRIDIFAVVYEMHNNIFSDLKTSTQ